MPKVVGVAVEYMLLAADKPQVPSAKLYLLRMPEGEVDTVRRVVAALGCSVTVVPT